jgi:hypothetical protein
MAKKTSWQELKGKKVFYLDGPAGIGLFTERDKNELICRFNPIEAIPDRRHEWMTCIMAKVHDWTEIYMIDRMCICRTYESCPACPFTHAWGRDGCGRFIDSLVTADERENFFLGIQSVYFNADIGREAIRKIGNWFSLNFKEYKK